MPDPVTPESIAQAASGPASASGDQGSASAHSIPDQLLALQQKAAADAAAAAAAGGGNGSGWNMLRPAKAVPPGTV